MAKSKEVCARRNAVTGKEHKKQKNSVNRVEANYKKDGEAGY